MKRILLLGLIVAVMAGAGMALSATSGGGMPGGPAIWGGGHATPLGDRDFSIAANHGRGTFLYGVYGLGTPVVGGNVTCLNVSGNYAVIGGIIREAHYAPDFIGTPFLWYAVDNGGPSSSTRDQISASYLGWVSKADLAAAGLPKGFPHVCPSAIAPSDIPLVDLTAGDLVVQTPGW
jgi:hypothetical protein